MDLPRGLQFDWWRDYGPLWSPGSTAFWLEPGPGDLPAGEWPLPYTIPDDLPTYNAEEGEWYHHGHRVAAFNWRRDPDGHTIVYADHALPPAFISDFHLGLCSGRRTVHGYLGRDWWAREQWKRLYG